MFLTQNPDVLLMVTQSIAIRMRGLLQRVENIALGNATQKVGATFFLMADRFGKKGDKGITIPFVLTHQDVAEFIGISRETTSIEIKKLIDVGVLQKSSGSYTIFKMTNGKLLTTFHLIHQLLQLQ